MAVIRTQYGVVSASTTINSHVTGTVDLPRPADAVETNTIDWVTRPAFRKEFESGRCVITPDLVMGVAGMLLVKVEIIALNPGASLAPLDLSFSQFPENDILTQPGFPSATLRTLLDLSASPTTSPYVLTTTVTGGLTDPITQQLLASIILRADEFVRLTLYNSTGAPITGTVTARYDFGMNSGNYGSIPLLI